MKESMPNNSKFVLFESLPLPYFTTFGAQNVNISDIVQRKGVFQPRMENEPWEKYIKREDKALEKFNAIVFGDLCLKTLKFTQIPNEYNNYQWAKRSEFESRGFAFEMVVSLDNFEANESFHRVFSCFSESFVCNMFACVEDLVRNLRNTSEMLKASYRDNKPLRTPFWLSCTGVSKRTACLEELPIGASLSFLPKTGRFAAGCFELYDSNRNCIGEISQSNDKFPNDSKIKDDEYWEIFKPLIENGNICLQNASLSKIIKHGTPKGKPRKALAEVMLEFTVDELPELSAIDWSSFQNSVNTMSKLAKIDYNRKCDIISGKTPYNISLIELFDLSCVQDAASYELITEQKINLFKLDDVLLTDGELISFWNVFRPLYSCVARGECSEKPCFKKDGNLLYKVSFEEECVRERLRHYSCLTIYRKI